MGVDYWFLLPVGVSIAFLAMSSGISAGNFWVPVFLLWTQFDAQVAFWMTLTTMLCGYGSRVVRNLQQGTIHRDFLVQYLPFTIPAAVIGAYLSPMLNVSGLILVFGVFVCGYGVRMLMQKWHQPARPQRLYTGTPWGIAIAGGVLLGLITVGLGELMLPLIMVGALMMVRFLATTGFLG